MNWNSVLGLASSVAILFPILCIVVLRLASYRTFPALLLYYLSIFLYNLVTMNYLQVSLPVQHYWGLVNNLLDAPLMLTFLLYFSPSRSLTRKMEILVLAVLLFEVVTVFVMGLNKNSITLVLGVGMLLVISFCLYFFVRQTRLVVANQKATGKTMITAALLFAYGCYGLLYILYFLAKTPYVQDSFSIYYAATILSSLLLGTGIIVEAKRIRKLQELKVTRRELLELYADEKKAVSLHRTAMLDFDREQWN